MISECPHCEKSLQFNDAQQEKLQSALEKLQPDATLKLGCPHCKKPIKIKADGQLADEAPAAKPEPAQTQPATDLPEPPAHPDIGWLASGMYDESDVVEDVKKVMILMPEGEGQDAVAKAFTDRGYHAQFPESATDAIAQMRFVEYAAVVYHTSFGGPPGDSVFHDHMESLPMTKRRYMFYVLVGSEFHTLYDLEALAYSANIVVNDDEVAHIDVVLKKGFKDYDELFGPLIEAIKNL